MAGSTCVRCGGRHLIKGICPGDKRQAACGFLPNDVKHGFWDWNPLTVGQVENGHTACLSCGLVWFEVRPAELRELIAKKGTEEAKRALPPPQWSQWPPHGTDPAAV